METEHLIFREYTQADKDDLAAIISDAETMKYYAKPYDQKGVQRWIDWNLDNYRVFGFGMWVLQLKPENKMIGDCGITMQIINGKVRPEIGYHINKNYQKQGYASEAAKACRDYVFTQTPFQTIYSYMNTDNYGSCKVAINNGLRLVEEYQDTDGSPLSVYALTKQEWLKLK